MRTTKVSGSIYALVGIALVGMGSGNAVAAPECRTSTLLVTDVVGDAARGTADLRVTAARNEILKIQVQDLQPSSNFKVKIAGSEQTMALSTGTGGNGCLKFGGNLDANCPTATLTLPAGTTSLKKATLEIVGPNGGMRLHASVGLLCNDADGKAVP